MSSKIICPTCKAVGYQPASTPNHFIKEQECPTCSGTGYLSTLEQVVGLEVKYPIISRTTGEVLAHPLVRISPVLAKMILEGEAFIDVEIEWEIYFVDGTPIHSLEQVLNGLHTKSFPNISIARLRDIWKEYISTFPGEKTGKPYPALFNEIDVDYIYDDFLNYAKKKINKTD